MKFWQTLKDWWNVKERDERPPRTMNNAAPRDHFKKFTYVFHDITLGKLAAIAVGMVMLTVTFNWTGSSQSWTVPAGCTTATFVINGAGGGSGQVNGGNGGQVSGTITVTPTTVYTLLVGAGGTQSGGSSTAGGGCLTAVNGGGGWSGLYQSSTLLALAAGGGAGGDDYSGVGGNGGNGGGSVGVAGQSPVPFNYVNTGGGGGTQTGGGAGGTSSGGGAGSGYTGTGSPTNSGGGGLGGAGSGGGTYDGGGGGGGYWGGGGGGGYLSSPGGGGGGGSSYVTTGFSTTSGGGGAGQVYTVSASQNGSVTITYASAPSAPTLIAPAASGYADATSAITFTQTYNSTDGYSQNAYAMRIKSGASYSYWNATSSTLVGSIVWNSISTAPGANWNVVFPANTLTNGNTYNWSMASQESGSNIQGSFATDSTFTTALAPTVVVNGPSGTITGTTQPTVTWTSTTPAGSQIDYQVWVESGGYGTVPGSGTLAWGSGVVSSSATSVMVGTALALQTTYRVFVQITETGGQTSPQGASTTYSTFTLNADAPATPTITATAYHDPTTGLPEVQLVVQGNDNELTLNQASIETNTTGWAAGANTTITQSATWAQDGSYSLRLQATASGAVSATTPTGTSGVPVVAGQTVRAMAFFHSPSSVRVCTVQIAYYNAAGTLLSTVTSPNVNSTLSGNGGQGFYTGTAPTNAAYMTLIVNGAGLGSSEFLYADCFLVGPGSSTTWTTGGFFGSTVLTITRSDGVLVRGAGWDSTLTIGTQPGQTATLYDQEAGPNIAYTYSAVVSSTVTGLPLSSSTATSASVTTNPNNLAWLFDPLTPSTAVGFVMSANWQPLLHEVGQAYYPVGASTASKSTDGTKGLGGTIPIFTSSVAQDAAIRTLIADTDVICLLTPARGVFYLMHDPSQDSRGAIPFSWEATTTPNNQWNFMTLGASRP